MTLRIRSQKLRLVLASQIAIWPGFALAQTQAGAPGPAGPVVTSIGEVIVTAQRRSENLQKVPVSVSVVSAEALAKQNITTEADLQFAAPGLTVRTGATSNEVNYAIRGQSVDQYSGATPGVLPYINDVQIGNNSGGGAGTTAFYDLQSIQVLKGPQGTLFGRNATGGAVLFSTQKPTNDFGGYVSALGGTYDTYQFEGALNLPIVPDKLLGRISGFYGHQEGYQHNLYDGSHPGTDDREGVRASLTFKPTDTFKNDLVVDYYHIDGSSEQAVIYNLVSLPTAAPAPFLYSPAFGPTWTAYLAAHPNPSLNPAGLAAYLVEQNARGPYEMATNDQNVFRGTNVIVTNTSTYDLGEHTQLKNIFGFGRLTSEIEGDSDGTPYGIAGDGAPNAPDAPGQPGGQIRTTTYSDELQLSGKTLQQRLTYATGLYFSDEKSSVRRQTNFFDILGVPAGVNDDITENTTYAVYGQGTYDLSELTKLSGLSVTGGLRYNSEKAQRHVQPQDGAYGDEAANPPDVYQNDQSKTFDNLSWTVGAQEQIDPNLLFYVTSRRSYKNGGFNAAVSPKVGYSDVDGDEYRTERVTDVEVGAKFQGVLQGMPSRLNIAAYNNWIDNSQRTAFASVGGSPSAITINVPRSEDFGVEFDGQIRPAHGLSLGASVNYIDARFTDQIAAVNGGVERFATVPDTPEWSGTIYGEITHPVTDSLSATIRAEAYSQTSTFFSSSANVNTGAKLPGYTLANFRFGLDDSLHGWSLSANLKNAFNRTYYVGGLPLGELLDYNTALPGAPRTFTIEARYKF